MVGTIAITITFTGFTLEYAVVLLFFGAFAVFMGILLYTCVVVIASHVYTMFAALRTLPPDLTQSLLRHKRIDAESPEASLL